MFFSHFLPFSVFPTIFHVLQCVFLIFQNCQFLAIFQVLQCAFLIFHLFSVFLAIIQDLQCVSLIFHVFQCYLPYFTSYSVHFSFSTLFSVPRHFPGQTMFVSHFSRFYFFSQYSMSYSVHFSFSTFFSVS